MPTPLRRGLRFAGKSAWYSFALVALLLAVGVGAAPRYFSPADLPTLPAAPALGALTQWSRALSSAARTAEHPFNAGLMLEALAAQARKALHSRH